MTLQKVGPGIEMCIEMSESIPSNLLCHQQCVEAIFSYSTHGHLFLFEVSLLRAHNVGWSLPFPCGSKLTPASHCSLAMLLLTIPIALCARRGRISVFWYLERAGLAKQRPPRRSCSTTPWPVQPVSRLKQWRTACCNPTLSWRYL